MQASSACPRPMLAGRPSSLHLQIRRRAPPWALSDPWRRPPVEVRPPLSSTKDEDGRAPSSAVSPTKNRLGRGSLAHRARIRRSIVAVHRRQIKNAPRRPTSRTGTRGSAAAGTARALPGGARWRWRRREGERWGRRRWGGDRPWSPVGTT
jgi:hypothetical protein